MSAERRWALLSVSDKRGLVAFAQGLTDQGFHLLSTGGTAKSLAEAGLTVTDVSAHTGFPEIMDGRVKTLHPRVHAGILARSGTDDAVLREHHIDAIELVVVNLYPFTQAVADPEGTFDDAIENIDIGGPAMVRAAAKNHARVAVVVDPQDYDWLLDHLQERGGVDGETRQRLAAKAFAHTAAYDGAISNYLNQFAFASNSVPHESRPSEAEQFPHVLTLQFERSELLRYGENPHQSAAFYRNAVSTSRPGKRATAGVSHTTQLQGRALSFNNIADTDAAFECVQAFEQPACAIVKHANPCGVAVADNIAEAYDKAYRTDPTSAFGGIIAFNRRLDADTVNTILQRQFVEVVIAPDLSSAALAAFASKPNVRVLRTNGGSTVTEHLEPPAPRWHLVSVNGGLLVQEADQGRVLPGDYRVVTRRAPTTDELQDLDFAWTVVKFVKSNAIVYVRDGMTLGIGAGQMSRVDSTRIAALKAEREGLCLDGAVLASDAFFPFRDGIDTAAATGIRAIVQPGGSMRDEEVVAAADTNHIAMVFTGMRHFRH